MRDEGAAYGGEAWCALECLGGAEFALDQALREKGFKTWAPAKQVWRNASRYSRARVAVERPIVSNYLFLAVALGVPIWHAADWHELFRHRQIFGVVMRGGAPALAQKAAIDRMVALAKGRAFSASIERRDMVAGGEFEIGDKVRFIDGPFEGQEMRAEGIRTVRGRAVVRLFSEIFPTSKIETDVANVVNAT